MIGPRMVWEMVRSIVRPDRCPICRTTLGPPADAWLARHIECEHTPAEIAQTVRGTR